MKNITVEYVDSEYDDAIEADIHVSPEAKARMEQILGRPIRELKSFTEAGIIEEKQKIRKQLH